MIPALVRPELEAAAPFAAFAPPVAPRSALRRAVTAATRRPEAECLAPLLEAATLPTPQRRAIAATARTLVHALRARPHGSMVEALVQEFALSSREGVALMCLAEALLRIPDDATRDALIRDKIGHGDWLAHLGLKAERSLFANAATWGAVFGLALTGRLAGAQDEQGLGAALTRLVARCGEPVIRRAVDLAVGLMGEQFVMGETIVEALDRARRREARGFLHSYDMLGEAALTAADAQRYFTEYEAAIHAIGRAAAGRGVVAGPGISIKLSALHPRYARAKAARVMAELLPRVLSLAALAKSYDMGLNIDAEEQDRLELSLDLLEGLCAAPQLAGWDGLGFVVQAYGRRCPAVLDLIIDLARRHRRRLMVRLVKGAYWDAEIKRAQIDGLADFPVFTQKLHTDVSYIACARKLLDARDAVFPQFATHNAQTLATIYHLAGPDFAPGSYEFQCLHGMGETLYDEVVGPHKLRRPCRIYAPVGSHQTLLAYLVRRLLENGANSSFVHRIADATVPVEALIADPAALLAASVAPGAPHPGIAAPSALFADRRNSSGLDLACDDELERLAPALVAGARRVRSIGPVDASGLRREVRNPGDRRDLVGLASECSPADVPAAMARAVAAAPVWAARPVAQRVAPLRAAADALESDCAALMGLIMREAGKSAANAVAELREAVDFLRYYANEAERLGPDQQGRGPMVCISPWNFPLAIFTGQVAAALAAGNVVLAKPAEETPLIAAAAVRLLHASGIPGDVLQLLPGDGALGAALVAAPPVEGVLFTGSTEVARLICATLAERLAPSGQPVALIAETGGQNAMVVDSSALAEQVVADVLASAFDSAGQRCSALRLLCLQEEGAKRILTLLKGAMAELAVGPTDRLSSDVGPVITAEAKAAIEAHVAAMAARGHRVFRLPLPEGTAHGTFVAPTVIEIDRVEDLGREVFGPVLHVLRYRRADRDRLLAAIDATGYGLTFGLHTRLDASIAEVTGQVRAGNIYVNRNTVGAVVGVQPFGGRGLSGTGPKAGGPLYLQRLTTGLPRLPLAGGAPDRAALVFADWLDGHGLSPLATQARAWAAAAPLGQSRDLAGPVGEANRYGLVPRGTVLLSAKGRLGLLTLLAACLATGNRVLLPHTCAIGPLPPQVEARIQRLTAADAAGSVDAALMEGQGAEIVQLARQLAGGEGALIPIHAVAPIVEGAAAGIALAWLLRERSVSVNTAAAGGNASLMALAG